MDTTSILLGLSNLSCAGLYVVLAIPLLQRKVKMNRWYGVRVRKAFESDENWYRINAYGARRLILWSVVLAIIGLVTFTLPLQSGGLPLILAFACAPLIVIIPCIEAYLYAKRL